MVKHVVLPFLLLLNLTHGATKIEQDMAQKILRFSLYNYDNLIADHYEESDRYIHQLSYLLSQGTNVPLQDYKALLNSAPLTTEANPVRYMKKLNKHTKQLSGYYFVDD